MYLLSKMLGKQHIVGSFVTKPDCGGRKRAPNSEHVDEVLGKKFLELYFAK